MESLASALHSVLDPQALVLLLMVLLALRAFRKLVDEPGNPIELWHFYASHDSEGRQWGDQKKLAMMVGIFASTVFVGYVLWSHKVDVWILGLFAIWLTFISAIDVFSAWARSFADRRWSQAAPAEKPAPQTEVTKTTSTKVTT